MARGVSFLEERATDASCRRFEVTVPGLGELVFAHRIGSENSSNASGPVTASWSRLVAASRDPDVAARLGLVEASSCNNTEWRCLKVWDASPPFESLGVSFCRALARELRERGVASGAHGVLDALGIVPAPSDAPGAVGPARLAARLLSTTTATGSTPGTSGVKNDADVTIAASTLPNPQACDDEDTAAAAGEEDASRATRPIYVALLRLSDAKERRAVSRAAILAAQNRRSELTRATVARLLGSLKTTGHLFFAPVLAALWPRVTLVAPAKAEQLWRGALVEVVLDVEPPRKHPAKSGSTSSTTTTPATRLAVQIRREDDGASSSSSSVAAPSGATTVERVASAVAVEHRSQDFSASLLRTRHGAARLVVAGPPYRKSYYRTVYATQRRWTVAPTRLSADDDDDDGPTTSRRKAGGGGPLASAEHLLDKRHADDAMLRALLGVPECWDALAVVELVRGVALSFVLHHYVSLDIADRRDGLVVQCLHAAKFVPPLPS